MTEFFKTNNLTEAKRLNEGINSLIISEGLAENDPAKREKFRDNLRDRIKRGEVTRNFLKQQGYPSDKILVISEIIDFLIPSLTSTSSKVPEEKLKAKLENRSLVNIKYVDEVLLPTRDGEPPATDEEGGGDLDKKIIPRFEMLVDFLDKNGIKPEEYCCIVGKILPEMMRAETYIMFILPTLGKMALVCDEEGNATYVIHTSLNQNEFEKFKRNELAEESERSPEFYYQLTKQDLQVLEKELEVVSKVVWNDKNWLILIENELTKKTTINVSRGRIEEIIKNSKIIDLKTRQGLTLNELRSNPELLKQVVKQIETFAVSGRSHEKISIPGREETKVLYFLERIGYKLNISRLQTKEYLTIFCREGEEVAQKFLSDSQEKNRKKTEIRNAEQGKTLSLNLLKQDHDLLGKVIEQIKKRSVISKEAMAIPGYENVKIFSFFVRIGGQIGVTRVQARDYLTILYNQGEERAQDFLLEKQKENTKKAIKRKANEGKPLTLDLLKKDQDLLGRLVEQIESTSVRTECLIDLPNYEKVSIYTFLVRIGNQLNITTGQARAYCKILSSQGENKAQDFLISKLEENKKEAEGRKAREGKIITLEALKRDKKILSLLVARVRRESVYSRELIEIPEYEKVKIYSFLARICKQNNITFKQAKEYLIILCDQGEAIADEKLKIWQKNK